MTFALKIDGRPGKTYVETVEEGQDEVRAYIEDQNLGARDIGTPQGVAKLTDERTDAVLGWYQYNGRFVPAK